MVPEVFSPIRDTFAVIVAAQEEGCTAARDDARALHSTLTNFCRIPEANITLLAGTEGDSVSTVASKEMLLSTLVKMADRVGHDSQFLLFYSGPANHDVDAFASSSCDATPQLRLTKDGPTLTHRELSMGLYGIFAKCRQALLVLDCTLNGDKSTAQCKSAADAINAQLAKYIKGNNVEQWVMCRQQPRLFYIDGQCGNPTGMFFRCFDDGVRGAVRCPNYSNTSNDAWKYTRRCDFCSDFRAYCVGCEGPYITQQTLRTFVGQHCEDGIESAVGCAAISFSTAPEGNLYLALYHEVPLKAGGVCLGTTVFTGFANRHHIEQGLCRK
jgi:hypothetical protein